MLHFASAAGADHSPLEKFPRNTAEKRDLEKDGEREYRGRNSSLSDQGSRHTPDQGAMCVGKRFLLGGRFQVKLLKCVLVGGLLVLAGQVLAGQAFAEDDPATEVRLLKA